MLLCGLIQVVGDGRPVSLHEEVSFAVDERTPDSAQESLDDCLHVARVTPQPKCGNNKTSLARYKLDADVLDFLLSP